MTTFDDALDYLPEDVREIFELYAQNPLDWNAPLVDDDGNELPPAVAAEILSRAREPMLACDVYEQHPTLQ